MFERILKVVAEISERFVDFCFCMQGGFSPLDISIASSEIIDLYSIDLFCNILTFFCNLFQAPPSVFDEQEDAVCQEASQNEELCHQDPKCSYCHEWTGGNKACLSRSDPSGCRSVPTNGMCPGVCGSQNDCTSCLLFGNENCFWCSAQQRCMNKSEYSFKKILTNFLEFFFKTNMFYLKLVYSFFFELTAVFQWMSCLFYMLSE